MTPVCSVSVANEDEGDQVTLSCVQRQTTSGTNLCSKHAYSNSQTKRVSVLRVFLAAEQDKASIEVFLLMLG